MDIVLDPLVSVRPGVGDDVADEQVSGLGGRQALKEVQNARRVDEDVVVALEDEAGARAALAEPLPEEHVLQRQVEERVAEVPLQDVPIDVVLIL